MASSRFLIDIVSPCAKGRDKRIMLLFWKIFLLISRCLGRKGSENGLAFVCCKCQAVSFLHITHINRIRNFAG